jgi:hypothetical protein
MFKSILTKVNKKLKTLYRWVESILSGCPENDEMHGEGKWLL